MVYSTHSQVVRKIVSVQWNDSYGNDSESMLGYSDDIVGNYVMSLLYKFLQFDSNFNVMLVFAHSYDIQPFHDRYLQNLNATSMGCNYSESCLDSYRDRESNILLTYSSAMLEACTYTDMVIFVNYLPDLEDYSLAVHTLKAGCGFCYLIYDPETVEADTRSPSICEDNSLESQLQRYHSVITDEQTPLSPVQIGPSMEMLATMLEVEESVLCNRYYDAVTY
ncbi:HDL392Cp [Eremothecium sinecaudum]|uniref:HDL392Cp n=1 Tax=Eremothecium sinecaudum TaxID=45286 RepID=A0A0X8HRX0_9SACH|nr:HDL392Cp [Eremothecium sinecaudum]AMD20352.1 HDL392Cp [Eremothecium sinecaudum]